MRFRAGGNSDRLGMCGLRAGVDTINPTHRPGAIAEPRADVREDAYPDMCGRGFLADLRARQTYSDSWTLPLAPAARSATRR